MMTPHKQLYRHKPDEGVYGDCNRTVVACLLDMSPEDVPHWMDPAVVPSDEWIAFKRRWLAEKGYALINVLYDGSVGVDGVMLSMKNLNPGIFYMLSGMSRNGVNHVVVCCGDKVVHDPSIDNSGIVGPCDDGYIWIEFLTPISQVSEERKAA